MAVAAAWLCVAIWLGDPTTPGGPFPVCPTKLLLGLDCPGCGTLRMLYSLLHGDVGAAVRFNAVGLLGVILLLWAYGAWTYGRLYGRRIFSWQHYRWSAPVALVVMSIWFVVRNLPVEPFRALRV